MRNADATAEASTTKPKPIIGVTMGSATDFESIRPALALLDNFSLPYELTITSSHRTPQYMLDWSAKHPHPQAQPPSPTNTPPQEPHRRIARYKGDHLCRRLRGALPGHAGVGDAAARDRGPDQSKVPRRARQLAQHRADAARGARRLHGDWRWDQRRDLCGEDDWDGGYGCEGEGREVYAGYGGREYGECKDDAEGGVRGV